MILFRLIYGRDTTNLMELYKPYSTIEYINNNYADNLKDWKSIMSYCFFINGAVFIWSSKK